MTFKQHIAVDTDGLLLTVYLTLADISDSTGAHLVVHALAERSPLIKHLFGDAGHGRRTLLDNAAYLDFTDVVVRDQLSSTAAALGRRAYFASLMRYRRLVRSYGQHLDVSKAMMYLARLILFAPNPFPLNF